MRISVMKLNRVLLCAIAVTALSSLALGQAASGSSTGDQDKAALEKQLWELDQKWLVAARSHKPGMDYLNQLFDDQFFEVIRKGQLVSKSELIDMLGKAKLAPGQGAYPDQFKLMAVYGDVAFVTDRTTLRGSVYGSAPGDASGQYRVVRVFVKKNGQWKAVMASLVPIEP
jgi:ketosteroid isomerase-like protein